MTRTSSLRIVGITTALWLTAMVGRAEEVEDVAGLAKKIAAAWKQRATAIKSLHLEAAAKLTTMVTETIPEDPFDTPVDPDGEWRSVVDEQEITYSLNGQKRAASLSGNQWHPQLKAPKYQAMRVVFDGREYATLFEGGTVRHAMIGKGIHAAGPLNGYWLQPVQLFLDPGVTLEKSGYRLDHAQVRFNETTYNRTNCLEARMPLTHQRRIFPRVGIAYLDPKVEFRLLAFLVQETDGTPMMEYTFTYAPNPRSGWLLSEWTAEHFRDGGQSDKRYEARVKRALINEPVDAQLFKVAFPIGTEIVEQKEGGGGKRYIQEADGSRRPISEKESKERRTPGNQPATSAA